VVLKTFSPAILNFGWPVSAFYVRVLLLTSFFSFFRRAF
jgi:hypothetical protein